MSVSNERVVEIVSFALDNSDKAACESFGINHETLGRYKRIYDELNEDLEQRAMLARLRDIYSPEELRALAKGGGISPDTIPDVHLDFEGQHIRFGYITDTHVGNYSLKEAVLLFSLKKIRESGAEFLIHTGDVTDGFNPKKIPGHIYELKHVGYDAQRDAAVELLAEWDRPMYAVSGNHDRWYKHSAGANVVQAICDQLPRAVFRGDDVGRVYINDVQFMLWHGGDGSSYAISYRPQKIVEGFSGGTKPKILFAGHGHKTGYFFIRNVHVILGGCIELQTPFMRGKRIEAHPGFWIIDIWAKRGKVACILPKFHPFYA